MKQEYIGCNPLKAVVKWADDQISANWALYLEHLELYNCLDCMKKHLLLCEGYSMENLQFTGKKRYLKLAQRFRRERKLMEEAFNSGVSCPKCGMSLKI